MPYEELDYSKITDARKAAIKQSIHPISMAELKSVGEKLFPTFDNPWREVYFDFLKENAGSTFYSATTHDDVGIIYCHAKEKGIWFMASSGAGPLQERGLNIMKEIVEGKKG